MAKLREEISLKCGGGGGATDTLLTLDGKKGYFSMAGGRWQKPAQRSETEAIFAKMLKTSRRVRRAHAWQQVQDPADLAQVWSSWIDNPTAAAALGARGAAVVAANRGSLATTMAFLEPILAGEQT